MLKEAFPEDSEDVQSSITMRNGVPAQTLRLAFECLEMTFPDRLTSNNMWHQRSPDLNTCDFILLGYMKEEVH